MASSTKNNEPLKIFISYATEDRERILKLYESLEKDGFHPWMDVKELLAGQNWDLEINKAIKTSDVIMLCLTNVSVAKRGYIRREINKAIDLAQQQLDDDIFVIPARLDECTVPESLSKWQYVDLFMENGYQGLLKSLNLRADQLSPKVIETNKSKEQNSNSILIVKLHSIAQLVYNQTKLALQENQEILTPALQGLESPELAIQKMVGVFHRQKSRGFFTEQETYLSEILHKIENDDVEIRHIAQNLLNIINELIDIFYSYSKAGKGEFITKSAVLRRETRQTIDSEENLEFFVDYLESLRARVDAIARIVGKLAAMLDN
jgi:hypothetical protein